MQLKGARGGIPELRMRPDGYAVTRTRQTESSEMTEAEAIRLAQQGDAGAFAGASIGFTGRRVYALCLRMVGNMAEAEDLTQDAFLQLFRKIATFRGESAFSTWLHRLAVNVVLMKLRKKLLSGDFTGEKTNDPDDETSGPRREIGVQDLLLTGSIDRVHLDRAIER